MKKVKFPKKYKYGFRLVGDPATWFFWWRLRIPKKVFRLVCWIKKHNYHIYWPYGVKIKQCDRCAHVKYKKQTTERLSTGSIYKGEIGTVYGIRFISTKRA